MHALMKQSGSQIASYVLHMRPSSDHKKLLNPQALMTHILANRRYLILVLSKNV